MSKLIEYINELKKEINDIGNLNEIEIMRYVYIKLGKKMDFDLDFTFGNKKTRLKIYNKYIDEEELDRVLDTHTMICKSIAYLLERVLKEFNIDIKTVKEEPMYYGNANLRHVYNVVTLKNGRQYILDLEEDLEYIQSGAKTVYFGKTLYEYEKMISDKDLKEIDVNIVKYIPEGYYFDDIIWMLKKSIDGVNIDFEEKVKFVLDNLGVYTDNKDVKYREKMKFHERVLNEVFSTKELRKIRRIDAINNNKKEYVSVIIVNNKNDQIIYNFSEESNSYEKISIEELADKVSEGFRMTGNITGLRKIVKSRNEER